MKRALFPGSFDPFTIGHADVVRRALPLFDEVIIAVGQNIAKQPFSPLEKRLEQIRQVFASDSSVRVISYSGLTIDLAIQLQADYILRGVRTTIDFEYERTMADANRDLGIRSHCKPIETIVLFSRPELAHISSSFVRDLASHGHDITPYLAQ